MTDTNDDFKNAQKKHDGLMEKMKEAKEKWAQENDQEEDDTDRLLAHAMEMAIEQGRGWAPGEKEAYIKTILDDDFIPPIFATNQQELEKSGLAGAFTSLIYDDETPTQLMLSFKQKGNDAFHDGKRSQVHNLQFYRNAINHYYEALAWAQKVEPVQRGDEEVGDTTEEKTYTEQELDEIKSTLCANAAMAHMQLKNWGHVRDDSTKVRKHNDLFWLSVYPSSKCKKVSCACHPHFLHTPPGTRIQSNECKGMVSPCQSPSDAA